MASAAPMTPAAAADQGATALLRGKLVLVADAHRGEPAGTPSGHEGDDDAAEPFLDVEGTGVPVDPASVAGVGSGSVLTVEVAVPEAVTTAVTSGEPVPVSAPSAGGEEAVIPVDALQAAQDQPAPADSDLAAATAVAASGGEAPVDAAVVTVAPAETAPASSAPHEVTVAVVGVNGTTDSRYDDEEVSDLVEETSSYWSDQTDGAVTFRLSGKATRYTSAISCKNAGPLWDGAKVKTGFQPAANKHLVLMLPRAAYDAKQCGYGLGQIGGGPSTGGISYIADASWPVLAHELGHNMSLWHANRLACTAASADVAQAPGGAFTNSRCREEEYGDRADVMSSSGLDAAGGLGAVGLRQLGLFPAGDQRAVTGSGVTSVALAPLGSGAGTRVATVTDPRNDNTYHLENRQDVGRDDYGFGGTGIYDAEYNRDGSPAGLRVLKRAPNGGSVLLDPTPTACASTCSWDQDAVIAPGTTFRSVADGVQIRSRQQADGSVVAEVFVARAGERHWGSVGEGTVVTAPPVKARSTSATTLPVTVTTAGKTLVPGGTVTVRADGARLGSATVSRGKASVKLPALPRGRKDLTVAYAPASTGAGADLAASSATVALDVLGATARVRTTLSPRTVTIADAPSATVSVSASGAVPSGTVTVTDGATTLGTGTLVKGRAVVALPLQALGKHSLVATYDGDEKVEGARATAAVLTVTPLPTSSVGASASRTTTAQQAVVTATVRAAGRAGTGEVSVVEGGQTVASGQLVNGRAALRLPLLKAGRHELSVVHAGSANVTGGAKALVVVVAPAKPKITIALDTPTIRAGSTGTVTVGVDAPGLEATGVVRLMRSRTVLDEAPLDGGRARLTVPADLPAGRYSLTVAYPGSTELAPASVGGTVTVVK